jgi:hypothetical protein
VPNPADPRMMQALVDVLNGTLLSSLLRVEIVSAGTTEATGLANLTELGQAIQTRLSELEQVPEHEREQESEWEQGGIRVVWRSRARGSGDAGDPVVITADS